jgi:hypothetical protein
LPVLYLLLGLLIKLFCIPVFTESPFTWRAIRLVVVTAVKTFGDGTAVAESSRILRVVASVPALSFPPPPGNLPLGFHRWELSLSDGKVAAAGEIC